MKKHVNTIRLAAALCAALILHGGPADAAADEGPLKVLFIGNSLTRHGKAPKIGWSNDWGMAASALGNDYAHRVTKGLSERLKRPAELRLDNLAAFERNLATFDLGKALAEDFAWRPDYVVVQLGENAKHPATDEEKALFRDKMTELFKLCARRAGTDMVATSVFCVDSVKPSLQRAAAKAAGVKFAPLYDLGRHDAYKAVGLFAHPGVAGHPGDRGHAMIAERILDAFFPKPLPSWSGDGLKAWRGNDQVKDLRVEGGVLKGRICGRDAQLVTTLPESFAPRVNQLFCFRMKTTGAGSGQVFWTRRGDGGPSESRQRRFTTIADGQDHDYRVAAGWNGPEKITSLRFDFPPDHDGKSVFEISEFRVVEEGELVEEDAKERIGVTFSLQVPPGLRYGQLSWTSDETGFGEFGFSTATDGRKHAYWFDLRSAKCLNWGPNRGKPCWRGMISRFEASRDFGATPLTLEGLAFVSKAPDLPADPVITSAFPSEAIPRAGRPLVVEAVVRNYGTRPAANLRFAFDGLPKGCVLLDEGELTPRDPLPGSDGRETVNDSGAPQLKHQRVFRFRLADPGAGVHRFGLLLAADGVPTRRVEVVADVKPSLGLAPQAYPAEPKPVDTAPYEIGALLFPGWTVHQWHAVWGHDPVRKPLLGWYDETKPETIDWQIKHLVENGVSFVSVDWYWNNGHQHLNHWMKAFKEAKFRKYLKWHLMWDNGYNSAEDQANVAKFWCENYFGDTQYQKIGGRPVVAICNPGGMEQRMEGKGGAKRLVEITQRVAREHGFPGVYFVAMRGMGADSEDPAFLRKFADYGFDVTTVYGFRGGIPGTPQGASPRRDFTWMADVSPSHWRALAKNGTLPFWPSLSTGYDDRPWRGERVLEIYNYNVGNFRRICEEGKKFSDETGIRTFLMGPLDEWGEGSIGYPNREHGFGILEAVRDTFGRKPAEGWPVNYAPEDVGLACPQKPGCRFAGADNAASETDAIQRRIDACFKAGGGTVVIEKGVHRVGGLRLRSKVHLHLAAGAVLQASRDPDAFADVMRTDAVEPVEDSFFTEAAAPFKGRKPTRSNTPGSRWNNAVIRIYKANDVTISGEPGSAIDGCNSYDARGEEDFRGVHGISAIDCDNLTLTGYTIRRTGNWAHRIMNARHVRVTGLTVQGGHDGMDFHGCTDVEISKCSIHSGDDCVAGVLNKGLHVVDCDLSSSCSNFRMGGNGILIERCRAHGPCEWPWRYDFPLEAKQLGIDRVPGYVRYNTISFFTHFGSAYDARPGDVTIRDCTVENADKLLHFNRSGNERWQHGPGLGRIEFRNVKVSGLIQPLTAYGVEANPVTIVMEGCEIGFKRPPEAFVRGAFVREFDLNRVKMTGIDAPFYLNWSALEPVIKAESYEGPKPEAKKAEGRFVCRPI